MVWLPGARRPICGLGGLSRRVLLIMGACECDHSMTLTHQYSESNIWQNESINSAPRRWHADCVLQGPIILPQCKRVPWRMVACPCLGKNEVGFSCPELYDHVLHTVLCQDRAYRCSAPAGSQLSNGHTFALLRCYQVVRTAVSWRVSK